MTRINWPGQLWAAAAGTALCCALTACSGGAGAHPGQSRAAALAQPVSGPAAVASVKADWLAFFNGATPLPRRLALLQNGQRFAAFVHSQAKTAAGALILQSAATVSAVKLQSPGVAGVTYTILLSGKPLAKNLHGTAVYTGTGWKVADLTFCGLLQLASGTVKQSLPAACGA